MKVSDNGLLAIGAAAALAAGAATAMFGMAPLFTPHAEDASQLIVSSADQGAAATPPPVAAAPPQTLRVSHTPPREARETVEDARLDADEDAPPALSPPPAMEEDADPAVTDPRVAPDADTGQAADAPAKFLQQNRSQSNT